MRAEARNILRDVLTSKPLHMKYTLWKLEHESPYMVTAYKVKDTNSSKEVDNWMGKNWLNAASLYHEENEVNANYLQLFQEN
jgi:hypothetical protein